MESDRAIRPFFNELANLVAVALTFIIRLATLWFAVAIGVVLLAVARRRIARRSG